MKLVTKEQIAGNPNFACDLTQEQQDELRLSTAQIIVNIGEEIKLSQETVATAILYTNMFFLQESYFENERDIIACASLFVAAKAMFERIKIPEICFQHWKLKHKGLASCPPIRDEIQKSFTDKLYRYECSLLRKIDFKIDLIEFLPWIEYTKRYVTIVFNFLGHNKMEAVKMMAHAIANDIFMTYCPMLYPVQCVALTCVLMAAANFGHPLPGQQNNNNSFQFNFDMCYEPYKRRNPHSSREEYNQLDWVQKIDERIMRDELEQCVAIMTQFYLKSEVKQGQ